MSGNVFSQGIIFAAAPILTRYYLPEEYGIFALYTAIAAIVSMIATGKYELAVVLPKKDKRAQYIVQLGLLISLTFLFLLLLIMVLLHCLNVNYYFGLEQKPFLKYSLFISVAILAINNLELYYAVRKKQFKQIGLAKTYQALVSTLVQVVFGVSGHATIWGLVCGQICGQLIFLFCLGSPLLGIVRNYNRKYLLMLMKKYQEFPRHMIVAGLVNNLSNYLPVFIIGLTYSSHHVGLYGLALRAIHTPMSIIGGSVADVYFQKANQLNLEKRELLPKKTAQLIVVLAILALIPSTILVCWGPYLFEIIFGKQWIISGEIARIMAGYLIFQFMFSPLARLFSVYNRQKAYQYWEISRLFLISLSLLIGVQYLSFTGTVSMFASAMALSYLFLGLLIYYILK